MRETVCLVCSKYFTVAMIKHHVNGCIINVYLDNTVFCNDRDQDKDLPIGSDITDKILSFQRHLV